MWQPIETAPKDQFLLLCGPSGYTTIPMVVTTGRMCSDYHAGRWIDHTNDDLTDWGFVPTHWMPMLTAPNAQPTSSVPELREALRCACNYIDTLGGVSQQYRAVLAATETKPASSIAEGFSREDLEAVADGLGGYEKTVNVGNATGEGDDHLESTTAYAARFIRAMLSSPETKP